MKKQKEANELITKGLLELGAVKVEGKSYPYVWYEIETKGGKLTVHCSSDSLYTRETRMTTISCYSMFDNLIKAKETGMNCNPWCGKHNWCQWSQDFTAQSFADHVLNDIKRMLPANPNADEFECQRCHGKFDIEDSVKKNDELYCEVCSKEIALQTYE